MEQDSLWSFKDSSTAYQESTATPSLTAGTPSLTATPPPLSDDIVDDNVARGVELATAIYLVTGGDDSWTAPSAAPRGPPVEHLPLEMIIKAQEEICQKVQEQDERIRRILQGSQVDRIPDLGHLREGAAATSSDARAL
uniref:Uncharacterized protein n=1 Tax=Alexandrium andersonii TaxID=327968 RepID=A0A7S2IIX8_9DINO